MKKSEFQKEINEILRKQKQLDSNLELQDMTVDWILKRSDELAVLLEDSKLKESERERLLREARELEVRLKVEARDLKSDIEKQSQLCAYLDMLIVRKIKEGLESD